MANPKISIFSKKVIRTNSENSVEVVRCFILAVYSYNLTMMIESIFSLLPSYFLIIFLAKYKSISKSTSYCFSVI